MRSLALMLVLLTSAHAEESSRPSPSPDGERKGEVLDSGTASISVQVTDGGETTIEVKNGELKVRAGGEETKLSAGQGMRVRKGEKYNKISLLSPPSKLQPGDGERFESFDIALSWGEVVGADKYKVVVASDAKFAKPVHESTGAAGVKTSVHLPAGTYYWKVRAVDKDGLEGRPTTVHRFMVDATPPKLKTGKPKWR
jgi:hypothetical protein